MHKKSFASDNFSGIHAEVFAAIQAANQEHVPAYGDDAFTAKACDMFRQEFADDVDVYFVFNGTAANVLSLKAMTKTYEAIICSDSAHIQVDECGAPECFIGSKLLPVKSEDGKLTINSIQEQLIRIGDQHYAQPKVVSISQSTELGTVYSLNELAKLSEFVHAQGMYLHMDGARISNAAASLGCDFKAMTNDIGVDVLSFGGTKNGLMGGEAVIIFNKTLQKEFKFIRKQAMQLASKMRFLSAQFQALLTDELWKRSATHANQMAQLMAKFCRDLGSEDVQITQSVDANALFVRMPNEMIKKLQEKFEFYVWDEQASVVRLMMSFDTQIEDIEEFARCMRECLSPNASM